MEPKLSRLLELRMARAESTISNFSSLFVRPGEPVSLTCTVWAPQATSYVYWYKNSREVLLFDSNLRRQALGAPASRFASAEPERARPAGRQEEARPLVVESSSSLIIRQAQSNDTANYTCLVSRQGLLLGPLSASARLSGAASPRQRQGELPLRDRMQRVSAARARRRANCSGLAAGRQAVVATDPLTLAGQKSPAGGAGQEGGPRNWAAHFACGRRAVRGAASDAARLARIVEDR